MVLTVLKARFDKTILAMVDLTALKSLAAHAATCDSLVEFEKMLK